MKNKKIVILENIRSCHNVGAIFRTADGAGFDEVVLTGYTPAPPDRRIEKVSLGAENFIKWRQLENTAALISDLKKQNFKICALEQTPKSKNIFSVKLPKTNFALVLGNEVEGVSPEVLALADDHFEIPMLGKKSSLNVSVAAGVAFFRFSN